jgi:hypothetical protein
LTWAVASVEFDGITVLARLSDGEIEVEILVDVVELTLTEAVLSGLHIQGPGPNSVGPRIRSVAYWMKEFLDVRRLTIEGATRTSGAGPGRDPAPIVF